MSGMPRVSAPGEPVWEGREVYWADCLLSSFISEFEDCWENFVYNKGESFMPWKGLSRNNRFLKNELKKILG
jgi:hypothetical protein